MLQIQMHPQAKQGAQFASNKSATQAIVIAAGMGARLGAMTESLPKCLLPLNGQTILDYQRQAFANNGIAKTAIVTGHQAEKLQLDDVHTFYNDEYRNNNILCSLMYAESLMDAAFIASYSDIVYASETVHALQASSADIAVVVDMDWRGNYIGRTEHPESEAEKAWVNAEGMVLKTGKSLDVVLDSSENISVGEFIGLFKCSDLGARLFKEKFEQAKHAYAGKPFYNAAVFEKAYVTDFLNYLIDEGVAITAVPIRQGWMEIDTQQDLDKADQWAKHTFYRDSASFLKAQGKRILSELNDFKRTIASSANELGWTERAVQAVIDGDTTYAETSRFMDAMCSVYPLERASLELGLDDSVDGVVYFPVEASVASARVFDRNNKEGTRTPYYEYRDTATSRLCAFRPEWIEELRVVANADPENPDVVYNNGHFMHQVTFFVGPVNFYYQIGDKKHCVEMNTGDSNYITPYYPHSFAKRDADQLGYIVAVSFGVEVRRALDEFYRMGYDRASQYRFDGTDTQLGQQQRIDFLLANECMTRQHLQKRLADDGLGETLDLLDDDKIWTTDELARLAPYLNVTIQDLLIPPFREHEQVVVRTLAQTQSYPYPSSKAPHYRVWQGARCRRVPMVKSFSVAVITSTPESTTAFKDAHGLAFNYGLYSYVFNFSEHDLTFVWEYEGQLKTQLLRPSDSVCVQPFVPFGFYQNGKKAQSTEAPDIFIVGIPGTVNAIAQKEMSAFADFSRVVSETQCWFS